METFCSNFTFRGGTGLPPRSEKNSALKAFLFYVLYLNVSLDMYNFIFTYVLKLYVTSFMCLSYSVRGIVEAPYATSVLIGPTGRSVK